MILYLQICQHHKALPNSGRHRLVHQLLRQPRRKMMDFLYRALYQHAAVELTRSMLYMLQYLVCD